MSGITIKNRGEKTRRFLNDTETDSCEIIWKQIKNIPCQLEMEQAGR